MEAVKFEIGGKYENMKGTFEVLSMDRNEMRIRWENGEEITTTKDLQQQIITRMNREREEKDEKKK